MSRNKTQLAYTFVGAVGIYLAHSIEYKVQGQEFKWEHMNRIVLYWVLGAGAYWILINQMNYIPGSD